MILGCTHKKKKTPNTLLSEKVAASFKIFLQHCSTFTVQLPSDCQDSFPSIDEIRSSNRSAAVLRRLFSLVV